MVLSYFTFSFLFLSLHHWLHSFSKRPHDLYSQFLLSCQWVQSVVNDGTQRSTNNNKCFDMSCYGTTYAHNSWLQAPQTKVLSNSQKQISFPPLMLTLWAALNWNCVGRQTGRQVGGTPFRLLYPEGMVLLNF